MTLDGSGNVGIGAITTTTDKLDVNGTTRISGSTTFGSNVIYGNNMWNTSEDGVYYNLSGTSFNCTGVETISQQICFSYKHPHLSYLVL